MPLKVAKKKMPHQRLIRMQAAGSLICWWWEHNMPQPLRKIWQFLMKLNLHFSYKPMPSPLGIHPRETKLLFPTEKERKETYTQIFIAALFAVIKELKTIQRSPKPEWMNTPWCIRQCSIKKQTSDTCTNLDESQGHPVGCKKSYLKKVTYYVIPTL